MRFLAMLLILFCLAALPGAAGQSPLTKVITLELSIPEDLPAMEPGVPQTLSIRYDWGCHATLPSPSLEAPRIEFGIFSEHPGIIASGPELQELPSQACFTQQSGNGTIQLNITATPQVPAERVFWLDVEAREAESNTVDRIESGYIQAHVAVAWHGAITLEAPTATMIGRSVNVPVRVTNTGNGLSQVAFAVTSNDPSLRLVPPAPVILEPVGAEESSTHVVRVHVARADGHSLDGVEVTLTAIPSSAKSGVAGEPASTTFRVADGGQDALVPAPGFVVVPLLAALAAIRRR